jgi:hypothetical protein
MAGSKIIQIGDVDLTGYALCEQFSVRTQAVYDDKFTPVNRSRRFIGDKYHISVSFEDLPAGLTGQIQTACQGDSSGKVNIKFLNPNLIQGVYFERPTVNAVISYGDEEHEYWNMTIEADSILDGL